MLDDKDLKMTIMSNLGQCYINMELFDDALDILDKALFIKANHAKTLFRKAKALAWLFQFERSIAMFEKLGRKDYVEAVKVQQEQANGNYQYLFQEERRLEKEPGFVNFVQGLELKMAPGKGRGLFASRNLAKGELLIAEKAISYGKEDPA